MSPIDDPLTSAPPAEVPLKNAPLVRVIAQIRFPEILAVENREFVAPFQEAIRKTYPVLRSERTQNVLLGPNGITQPKPHTAWRFSDADENWRVSLAPDFLALETTKYTNRSDFFRRLASVVEALNQHVDPKLVDRLGVRYIDRITGEALDDIARLVRPEVRGIIGAIASQHAVQALSESLFEVKDARFLARWGQLPANATIDPAAIEPAKEKSWILDLDMFTTTRMPCVADDIVARAQQFAERIYTMFRWAVTDDFLRHYGGTP